MVQQWQTPQTVIQENKQYSVGILLGGFTMYDRFDTGYFGNNADRFIQAANLYHTGRIKKILMTGGVGKLLQNEPTEAAFVKRELLRNGINAEDIIIEDRSRNTYENAIFSKIITDSLQLAPPYALVTSALHMPRSLNVFQHAGFNSIDPIPCDYKVINGRFSLLDSIIPDIRLLYDWQYFLHELVGLAVYRITGKA
ncbi:MAG: YdcF family protein [Sphingobacteriia bacterium]